MKILAKLQHIDRRYLWLLAALVIAVPIIKKPSQHPSRASIFPEVWGAYNTLNSIPKDRIVILSTSYGAGTVAENGPQTEALMRHLFSKGTKFVVLSWDPLGAQITYQAGLRIQNEMGKKYGEDWVHLGYRAGAVQAIMGGMGEDFQKVLQQDKSGIPLSKLPAVNFVKNYKQIGAVVDITSVSMMGAWIAYLTTPKHIPLIYCPTAVMSAEAYPYLDSGQLKGMLNGAIGAVQYETLIGRGNVKSDAAAISWALSSTNVYIILLIVLGNVGYLVARKTGIRTQGGPR